MIHAVIFDCFGVLYSGARHYVVSRAPHQHRQAVDELFSQADYGYITTAEFLQQVAAYISMTPEELATIMGRQYHRDEQMLASLARIRDAGTQTALLSNVNDTLIGKLFTPQELAALFNVVVTSSAVGMVKPHPEIYELAATKLGLLPEACLMIDDVVENVEGARRAGMDAVQFVSYDAYVAALAQRGIHA